MIRAALAMSIAISLFAAPVEASPLMGPCLMIQGLNKAVKEVIKAEAGGDTFATDRLPPLMPYDLSVDAGEQSARRYISTGSALWKTSWKGSAPDRDTIRVFVSSPLRSGAACLDGLGVTEHVSTNSPALTKTTLRLSAPVFNKQGTQALILIGWSGVGTSASSEFLLFGKEGASWSIIGRRLISVS